MLRVAKQKPLVSLTRKDFEWDYVRGSGKGGQKKNKTSSAVRCRHALSGAIGYAEDTRSQSKNRQLAFKRCVSSPEFTKWIRIESARASGELAEINRRIDGELSNPSITRIEVQDDSGTWIREQA
jgi:protein subunit release factor A